VDLVTMVTATRLLKLAKQSGNVAPPGKYDWMLQQVSIWHMIFISWRSDLPFWCYNLCTAAGLEAYYSTTGTNMGNPKQ